MGAVLQRFNKEDEIIGQLTSHCGSATADSFQQALVIHWNAPQLILDGNSKRKVYSQTGLLHFQNYQ